MRLLNSEITGKDRKQMSCVMKLCLPSLTYRTELSSAAYAQPLQKTDNFTEVNAATLWIFGLLRAAGSMTSKRHPVCC